MLRQVPTNTNKRDSVYFDQPESAITHTTARRGVFISGIISSTTAGVKMWCDSEDPADYPPDKPINAESSKFTYNNTDGLRYDRIARASEEELKREVRRRARHYTKPWAIAQLSLYGIEHKKSDSVGNLQKIFENAVKKGKVC
jgi:hypothetical protein